MALLFLTYRSIPGISPYNPALPSRSIAPCAIPIQRPSEHAQRPSALEVFTNREALIAAFERMLEHKKPEESRVLLFHGDGGIGKTTLLQKLEQLSGDD